MVKQCSMPHRRNLHRAIYSPTFLLENLHKTVLEVYSKYKAFQFLKRNKKQYRKLPPKEEESKAWNILRVDLIGQNQFTPKGGGKKYQMTAKHGKTIYLQAVTLIDPATGRIEMSIVTSTCPDLVSNIVELAWLNRYPLPIKVIFNCGNKF